MSMKKSLFKLFVSSLPKGILIGLFVALAGIGIVFLAQDRYRSSADFLVTSTQGGQDYYTATRSAEYMSRVLSEVLYSERFMNAIIETGKVNDAYFPRDKKERPEALVQVLDTNSAVVFGDDASNIKIRLLSGPILERNPSTSQFLTLLIASVALGVFGIFSARLIRQEFALPLMHDPRQ